MGIGVRSVSVSSDAAGAAVVVTKPAGAASGDYLLAVHAQDQFETKASMTASGWALVAQFGTDGGGDNALYKIWQLWAGGSEPSTYTFGQAGASVVTILALTGVDPTTPVNISPVFAKGASDPAHIASAITPSVADVLLVCGASYGTGGSHTPPLSYLPPSGMTEASDVDSGFQVGSVAYQLLSGGSGVSTGAKSFTSSDNGAFATFSLAIAPSTAPPAGAPRQPVLPRLAPIQRSTW